MRAKLQKSRFALETGGVVGYNLDIQPPKGQEMQISRAGRVVLQWLQGWLI